MVFGEKTRDIGDFIPRISASIAGADVDMVRVYAMDAIIQFLRDTKLLTHIQCIQLKDCTTSYKLNYPYRLASVASVRFFVDGQQVPSHRFDYRIVDDVFYIEDVANCGDTVVEVELNLTLPRDSSSVPEFIYEDWVEAITAYTLYLLYMQTDNAWYNPASAGNQYSKYLSLVKQASVSKLTKHKPLMMRLTAPWRL